MFHMYIKSFNASDVSKQNLEGQRLGKIDVAISSVLNAMEIDGLNECHTGSSNYS
jgi:hypothetical protein